MKEKDLLIAASLIPRFKLSWLSDTTQEGIVRELLQREVCDAPPTSTMTAGKAATSSSSSSADDFFMFARHPGRPAGEDAGHPELTGFLATPEDYPLSKMKADFPLLHDLFLRVNTAVPSSASVERLFSCAADIFTRKRAKLSDLNFEYQLLLKCNDP